MGNSDKIRAEFGGRIRARRKELGLTLVQVGKAAGLAASTISKIENGQLSPTYDVLLKLCGGLDDDLVNLFQPDDGPKAKSYKGQLDVTRSGESPKFDVGPYIYEPQANQLKQKLIDVAVVTVTARSPNEFNGPVAHKGEEIIYVLSGAVELHTSVYNAVRLEAGDSAYYDPTMDHRIISVSDEDARILNISAGGNMVKE